MMLGCAAYTMLSIYGLAGNPDTQSYIMLPSSLSIQSCPDSHQAVPTEVYIRSQPNIYDNKQSCGIFSMSYNLVGTNYNLMSPQKIIFTNNVVNSPQTRDVDVSSQYTGYGVLDSQTPVNLDIASCGAPYENFTGYIDLIGYGVADVGNKNHANLP